MIALGGLDLGMQQVHIKMKMSILKFAKIFTLMKLKKNCQRRMIFSSIDNNLTA